MKKNLLKTLVNVVNYTTEDFKTLPMQRVIYPYHVKNIVADFIETEICLMPLIAILTKAFDDEPTLYLADGGQRRVAGLEVLRKTGKVIPMDVVVYSLEDDTIENIALYMKKTNNIRKNWTSDDFSLNNRIVGVNKKEYDFN